MSKNRNRTIKLPTFPNYPLPDSFKNEKYFGEAITEENSSSVHSSSSIDSVVLSIQNLGSSSSSILSWGEDQIDGTKKVQEELQRMDRILAGDETIPPHYDWEEYKEWMEFFPSLRILGRFGEEEDSEEENTLLEDDCDTLATSKKKKKKAVISTLKPNLVKRNSSEVLLSNLHLDIDNYLKISPINQYYNYNTEKEARLTERQKSSKPNNPSAGLLKSDLSNFKDSRLSSAQNSSALGRLRRKNLVVLPPIEGSQCRSISAMPRTIRRDDFLKNSFRRKLQE